jgi:hypothetical protein
VLAQAVKSMQALENDLNVPDPQTNKELSVSELLN